jgi:hypothetical protein
MFSPRALFLAFPAVLVVVGSILMSRNPDWTLDEEPAKGIDYGSEIVVGLSGDDESRLDIIHQKQLTAIELLNNRCSLANAADRFLELNLKSSEAIENLRFAWQGESDWEKSLRQAVAFARALSRKDPERHADAMARIDAETTPLLQSELFVR